ncbi:MAG: hypothetical protein SNG81_04320 [Rikenellaceae bacterium]
MGSADPTVRLQGHLVAPEVLFFTFMSVPFVVSAVDVDNVYLVDISAEELGESFVVLGYGATPILGVIFTI